MTYCVGVKLDDGLIFASDSRTHAGVDNYASFCKMTVFEQPGDRVLVLLSSGDLAATQAVIGVLRQRAAAGTPHIWSVTSMFDVAISSTFGPNQLVGFQVQADEIVEAGGTP